MPILSHKNCQDPICQTCFDEHIYLGAYLGDRCGTGTSVDHLGKIHKWMKDNGRRADSNHGWASPETFEQETVDAYVKWYLGDEG